MMKMLEIIGTTATTYGAIYRVSGSYLGLGYKRWVLR